MRVLLDSHTLLWYAAGDPQLSAAAEEAIRDPDNDVLVSPATFWEVAIKVRLGKLEVPGGDFGRFAEACESDAGLTLLPITPAHTAVVATLPFPPSRQNPRKEHRDPFDRLLIAQALVEDVPLVTADGEFPSYSVKIIW